MSDAGKPAEDRIAALEKKVAELETSLAARDRFLSILSHDLRNPMTGIKGYASLLRQTAVEEKPKRWLNVMIEQIDFMTQFIGDLLDILRFDEDRLKLATTRVSLGDVIEKAAAGPQAKAQAKGVGFTVELMPGRMEMLADPDRLANALRHILDNAAKFTPAGGSIQVRVTAASGRARIEVEDNGPGIAPDIEAHLFDKLQSVYWKDRLPEQGSGLGLPLAHRLIASHQGSLEVDSRKGRGSRFVVSLPLAS